MQRPWRVIVGFATLGSAIAGASYVFALFFDYTKPLTTIEAVLGVAFFVFCPPTLLFVMCIDCEVSGWSGVFMYSIIGLLNAALYAVVAAIVVNLWKDSN